MTIKKKALLLSFATLLMLITLIFMFQNYRTNNYRLLSIAKNLDTVTHITHEIALDILLNLKNVESLKERLEHIPVVTHNLQHMFPNSDKPMELVNAEISIVRIKRIIYNLNTNTPISQPIIEQLYNEVEKINHNVDHLTELSDKEMAEVQRDTEMSMTGIIALILIYMLTMTLLLLKTVLSPLLLFITQIQKATEGELTHVNSPPSNDEIGLLTSVFNQLVDKQLNSEEELRNEISEHKKALEKVKLLSGFLPICASCKKVRDDKGYWNQIESYIRDHSEAEFSHSCCPECAKKLYPDIKMDDRGND